ncbi:hypothetical protein M409DRAFT_62638 [Zasmidium cellare ATCC 36951]|uniref:FAM192A/Fyv6 N-terminal domain-containing protein n=1 Tax=Zasmidium cellare ATCC 36951 TaxID=1080233 RepID=A0A6A6D3J8_ZASCE|nr:uncharacterized protein M409DRAFT_62638 [Zasmidium cellare ATCC 36951]KAF2172980.1 hypothetical protein M409DRAFT_62638 [Zasmidium cellare ATCC 36951]
MSRFVFGGTNDEPAERDEAWLKAQEEIEARAREKAEIGKQENGQSLYEKLQANKAAKQEQFEESARLKNQFRSLDEDEVEFLDSVLEGERVKEAAVKRQTREELDAFRRQQEEAEKAAKVGGPEDSTEAVDGTSWSVGKKRKKGREGLLRGVKLRKASSGERASAAAEPAASPSPPQEEQAKVTDEVKRGSETASPADKPAVPPKATSGAGLGLAAYSSDEDD